MKYYLVGIKGNGMSALAVLLSKLKETVIGSDKDEYFFTEEKLKKENIKYYTFNKKNINNHKNYKFIISYAYDEENNEEVKEIFRLGLDYCYYSDFINCYFRKNKIGISGTHGKTTVSTMLKYLLEDDKCTYLIGDGSGGGSKDYKYFILEACEYKNHFLSYDYDYLVINNIDYDHPDFFNSNDDVVQSFKRASKKSKCLIVNNDDLNCKDVDHTCKYTFGIKNKSFVNCKILNKNKKGYKIKIKVEKEIYIFSLPFYGIHMIYNFLAAFTTLYLLYDGKRNKIYSVIVNKIKKYKNPKRRNEEYILNNNNIIINDYAHHPTEIQCTYDYVKQKHNDYEIILIFQPHTYSRSIFLYKQFQNVMINKNVYIMDTFISREQYDSQKEKVIKEIFCMCKQYNREEVYNMLINKENIIVIFMGAGNIDNEYNYLLNKLKVNLK